MQSQQLRDITTAQGKHVTVRVGDIVCTSAKPPDSSSLFSYVFEKLPVTVLQFFATDSKLSWVRSEMKRVIWCVIRAKMCGFCETIVSDDYAEVQLAYGKSMYSRWVLLSVGRSLADSYFRIRLAPLH